MISIQDFAAWYMLLQSIQDKLIAMQLGGAHVLRKISDDALGRGGLTEGEVATVQDAEERLLADA